MGDFLRLLQTTADGWRFIGGTPRKGLLAMGVLAALITSELIAFEVKASTHPPHRLYIKMWFATGFV